MLCHGWLDCARCLQYLRDRLNSSSSSSRLDVVAHAAASNEGKTSDGVALGGARIALEIRKLVEREMKSRLENGTVDATTIVSLSLVGNSLGGLYARYALYSLFRPDGGAVACPEITILGYTVLLKTFVSTVTPHLGIASQTYVPVPRFAEALIGVALGKSGRDLVRSSDLLNAMSTSDDFLRPLSLFKERIAFSNAFETDFLVSHASALFLDDKAETVHKNVTHTLAKDVRERAMVAGIFTTERTFTALHTHKRGSDVKPLDLNNTACCKNLDSLSWKKYVIDLRKTLAVLPGGGKTLGAEYGARDGALELSDVDKNPVLSSKQLKDILFRSAEQRRRPAGHSMIVANMKNKTYVEAFKGGRPVMDFLADLLTEERELKW